MNSNPKCDFWLWNNAYNLNNNCNNIDIIAIIVTVWAHSTAMAAPPMFHKLVFTHRMGVYLNTVHMTYIWNPFFSICLVYAWYIPCICRPHPYTWNIRGICIDLHGYTTCIDLHGYTTYIHSVDIHGISLDIPRIWTMHIRGISMDMHGVSLDVYTWYIRCISLHIPSFLLPDFSPGPCCWSHSMRTIVFVIKSGLLHAPPWPLC
jgi:hypothetical protein